VSIEDFKRHCFTVSTLIAGWHYCTKDYSFPFQHTLSNLSMLGEGVAESKLDHQFTGYCENYKICFFQSRLEHTFRLGCIFSMNITSKC